MAGWRIEGQYMETCNCNFLCPCISSNLTARPSEGDCKAAVALRIDKGAKDGVKLDGSMVLPVPFDSTHRYPVVLAIYGGPGSQQVYDAFDTSGWTQWLAQQGYVVVGLNNRGTANYSRDFMKVVYRDLGHWEANDFAESARWLGRLPFVDAARIAIMGTSYGGYSTIFSMLAKPDVFRVGIANSPVTDWRLYDTIYTERYMLTPKENPKGYDRTSAVKAAKDLHGRLLIIHGMMDDNVHMQNSVQFADALQSAGKEFEMMFYPRSRHGIGSPHYLRLQIDFIRRTMGVK